MSILVFWVVTSCLICGYHIAPSSKLNTEVRSDTLLRDLYNHPRQYGVTTQKTTVEIFTALRTFSLKYDCVI